MIKVKTTILMVVSPRGFKRTIGWGIWKWYVVLEFDCLKIWFGNCEWDYRLHGRFMWLMELTQFFCDESDDISECTFSYDC